jgi:hypothetical protein
MTYIIVSVFFTQLEITVHTLQDKNALLRERVMELTGVISRWKEDFEDKGCHASIDLSEPEDVPANTRALQEAHENEIALRNLTEQQRSKIIELEEALVVSLGQITHVEEREAGLRDLLDVLRRGESDLKHRAAVQVSRVKQVPKNLLSKILIYILNISTSECCVGRRRTPPVGAERHARSL